jgi:hypothetical protein
MNEMLAVVRSDPHIRFTTLGLMLNIWKGIQPMAAGIVDSSVSGPTTYPALYSSLAPVVLIVYRKDYGYSRRIS